MSLFGKLYDLRRKWFGRYQLDDPRPIAAESPYTFYIPPPARLAALETGDLAKIIIRSIPKGREYGAERMWVKLTSIESDDVAGELDSTPLDIPQLRTGDIVHFKLWHVIDTLWLNSNKEATLPEETPKQVWDRCFVDRAVLDGVARVGFLYREEPDMAQEGDKYPDSGWRIRADVKQLSDTQYENSDPQYIAIGKVLNQDDSWIHLLEAPIGSKYLRNDETGEFEETD